MRSVIFYCFVVCCAPAIFESHGAETERNLSPGVKQLPDLPGVHNFFTLGSNVYSGSTPEGAEAFAALAKLGIKTILSVDGAKPEVELAKKYGLQYVHLPHSYDGISTNTQLQLAKAGEVLPGPIYVHCHHGKHRGPTAAAIICQAKDGWTPTQSTQWLRLAGTSTNYVGLYAAVRNFEKPSAAELLAVPNLFPESAQVSGIVDAMVEIDGRWENLKAIRAAGFRAPKDHPDIDPANEAVILWEHYREAQRLPDATAQGTNFIQRFQKAEAEGKEAERLLRSFMAEAKPTLLAELNTTFDAMAKSCSSCHKAHRD